MRSCTGELMISWCKREIFGEELSARRPLGDERHGTGRYELGKEER